MQCRVTLDFVPIVAALMQEPKSPRDALSLVVPARFPLLFLNFSCLRVESSMKSQTETLEIGSHAPDFSLSAANRDGAFTLGGLLGQRSLILEFLRGTW
jgi:hypothetical protein